MIKNIFCDRDGTIIYDKDYLHDPDGVELLPGSITGLLSFMQSGCNLFVVTNQSGIGRGMFSLSDYIACEERLDTILTEQGIVPPITAFCPHGPDEECSCRKPEIGMWQNLSQRYNLKPEECCMVGDKKADISFGKKSAFACTVLVLTGKGVETARKMGLPLLPEGDGYLKLENGSPEWPDFVASSLAGAAQGLHAAGLLRR